ncbi:MAG: alpha-amylase family glycosyl hydrolase [Gemmatimonadales bacterium]
MKAVAWAFALLGFGAVLAPHAPHRSTRPPSVSSATGGSHSTVRRESGESRSSVFWNSATVYFLLTDRFRNGDSTNDHALGRMRDGALLRSFEGGDLAGVLRTIEDGYFDSLGVSAIWMTPFVEQIHGTVDEGTGKTYGYHGYWTRDWTAVDPALGTKDDLRAVVDAAHRHGIRVIMDAVINHTGPATPRDPAWPSGWVRAGPTCTYQTYTTTVDCNLVATLPDVRTDRDGPVALPRSLLAKWAREGRRRQETAELDAFFRRTGYPRAPRYYVIKWLTDWVRELGFDGYRVDTAKHFEPAVSAELKREAQRALDDWRRAHPDKALDSLPFYMVGEVYGWEPSQGRDYSYGDRTVDFFANGYDGLINFGFKSDTTGGMDGLFTRYSSALHGGRLEGVGMLNYLASHDDGSPYDRARKDPYGDGSRLLLAPGAAQIYYGDELARPLEVSGAEGDANLRSFMNWEDLERGGGAGGATAGILEHWRRLGRIRREHPAVGAGVHRTLQATPYIFSRTLDAGGQVDRVLVAMGQPQGAKTIPVFGVFPDGSELVDEYSGVSVKVSGGTVALTSAADLVLLAERR